MLRHRVIPFLLIEDDALVKTTRFGEPKYIGDPVNAIRIFNEKEVDEIAVLDISATPRGQGPNLHLVRDIASECFMPLAYGGGVRSLDDAKALYSLGVEKVIMRSRAMTDLKTVSQVVHYAGSSSVAVCVDVKKSRFGRTQLFGPGTPLHGHPDWTGFIRRAIHAGAGEIILNSVDRDGSMAGTDLDLIRTAAEVTNVPLVAVGGVGSLGDIKAAIDAGADAVGAGAFFIFYGPRRAVLITYPSYEQLTELLGATR